jgi:hypothetical protein
MRMIGCFPDPQPDELFYSVCARFSARMKYPNKKEVLKELFGTTTYTAAVDLPSHLAKFVLALPPGHHYTVEHFIDGHTLLPFYSPFLPPDRVRQLQEDMSGDGSLAIHKRAGIMASRIPAPEWFRLCPVCVIEDKRQLGEAYWHRLHQLPGVLVCPDHLIFLENSAARRDSARDFLEFVPAEDAIRTLPVRHLDLSDRGHQVLLKLARDAAWLIGQSSQGSAFNEIYNRYLRLLIGRGLATYTGSIHVRELLDEFGKYYPPELLRLSRCEFTGSDQVKTNWLLRLVRPPKHAQHPLYHLLLIQFLGCTAEEFFRLPTELSFFGEGPWPCLNPAAEHFQEQMISGYELSSRLRGGRPIAIFRCCCGFTYARSGPDTKPEEKFRIGRVISFGPVWEARLKQLWKKPSLSLSEVGRQLGVDPLTVRRHAARLKLPTLRSGRKSKTLNPAARLKSIHDAMAPAVKRRTYRAKWAASTRQSPQITLRALRRRHAREYAWLLQNDSEWLKRNSPRPRRGTQSTSGVDWKKRDAETAVAVRTAATRLRHTPGRPAQVTRTAIGRAVGAVALLRQKLHKMPLTAQILANVVETREGYAVRRIRWAAECFIRECIRPRLWQLVWKANVYSLMHVPEVKIAIGTAVSLIESTLSLNQKLTA